MYAHCSQIWQQLNHARDILVVAEGEDDEITRAILTKYAHRAVDEARQLLAIICAAKFPTGARPY